jgi:hypothetical protein
MVAMAGASMVMGAVGSMNAASKARDAAKAQARLYNAQMLEEIRRKKRQNLYQRGELRATPYASGVQMAGTVKSHIREQGMEMTREIAWMDKHRRMATRAIKKGANIQYQAAQWQTAATAVQGLSNMYSIYSQGTSAGTSAAGRNMAGGFT